MCWECGSPCSNRAGDYVFASGELHSVQEVVEIAFGAVGLKWREYVKQDPRFMRPERTGQLVGNPAKPRGFWTGNRARPSKSLSRK